MQDRVLSVRVLLQLRDGLRRRQVSNLIPRRLASRFTSSMTGKLPVPVPITSRRHFHGMSSLMDSGEP